MLAINRESQIKQWISEDENRMQALRSARQCHLPDWCLAAGFVRNLVWDKLHRKREATPLNDIDLIYYNSSHTAETEDIHYETELRSLLNLPWSVKNQARMHCGNGDAPYHNTCDAMSYWVEVETAVGVRLTASETLEIVAPFGLEALFNYTITLNPKRQKPQEFDRRVAKKGWLTRWPKLIVRR